MPNRPMLYFISEAFHNSSHVEKLSNDLYRPGIVRGSNDPRRIARTQKQNVFIGHVYFER